MNIVRHGVVCIACALCSFVNETPAQQYWSQFPNSPSGTTRHDDICFIDANTGWATKNSLIYKTTDGGSNWVQKLSKTGTHFRCIGFASANRGWAGNLGPGSYDSGVTDTNVFYETFDGGETWSVVPNFDQSGMKGFCSMHVLDAQHIYGGGRVRGPAYFCKTESGGTNWTIINLTAQGVMNGIMDVYFKDTNNGFVVGMDTNAFAASCGSTYHGRIARTTDGGQTWTPVVTTTLECCYFWKMSWPSPEVGYASLQRNPTSSDFIVFYKTVDGGATWASNGVPVASFGNTQFYWQGIGFISPTEGWAGGESSSAYPNTFLHTTDGGASWTSVGYTNSRSINRIRFMSPVLGWACGQKLHVYHKPLAITSHPRSQTSLAGTHVQFSVAALGDPTIRYQWQKDGVPIFGATTATLALTDVTRANEGFYSVIVTNAGATLVSSNAELHILSAQRFDSFQTIAGSFRLSFGDSTGAALTSNDLPHLSVETSSNLVQWLPFTNELSLTNGRVRFEELLNQPSRFYRVLER